MSKHSANILVFGWSLVLLSVAGFLLLFNLKIDQGVSSNYMRSGECSLAESFWQKSDLTNAEKFEFTSQAIATSVTGVSGEHFRVILDYFVTNGSRKKIKSKLVIIDQNGDKLTDLSASAMLNGSVSELSNSKPDSFFSTHLAPDLELGSNDNSLGFYLSKNNRCEFKLNELINLDIDQVINSQSSEDFTKFSRLFEPGRRQITLKPGINFYGSSDWFNASDLSRRGFKLSEYDAQAKVWRQSTFGEPNKGYVIFNPAEQNVNIDLPVDYRVPDDIVSPVIKRGWNLLYRDNSSLSLADLSVSTIADNLNFVNQKSQKLGDLVNQGDALAQVYQLVDEKLIAKDFSELDASTTGFFWVYLKKEPEIVSKQPNLALRIIGGGDAYAAGGFVPLKLEVENNSDLDHFLVASGISDPCQIKVEVTDVKNRKLFDNGTLQQCPSWPSLEKLLPGAKKAYNYTWQIPKNVSGKLKISAYLNYARLGGQKVSAESEITIK